jgi:hypothetical protein
MYAVPLPTIRYQGGKTAEPCRCITSCSLVAMATHPLTRDDVCEIVAQLRQCFALTSDDWPNLEAVLLDTIKKSAVAELTYEPVREVLSRVEGMYDKDTWKKNNEIVFRACFVLIMMKRCSEQLLDSVDALLKEFPSFSSADEAERALLVKFRNVMFFGINLFNAKSNKGKLMELAGRLSGKVYTTGGGSTVEAKRRELIYQELGGVVKKKLTVPRKRKLGKLETDRGRDKGAHSRPRKVQRMTKQFIYTPGTRAARSEPVAVGSVSPAKYNSDALSHQDPELLLLEPMPETLSPALSSAWFQLGGTADGFARLQPPPVPDASPGSASPNAGDGEWSLSMCSAPTNGASTTTGTTGTTQSTVTTGAHPGTYTDEQLPAALLLQRSLTIDFSKPIFAEDDT